MATGGSWIVTAVGLVGDAAFLFGVVALNGSGASHFRRIVPSDDRWLAGGDLDLAALPPRVLLLTGVFAGGVLGWWLFGGTFGGLFGLFGLLPRSVAALDEYTDSSNGSS